MCARARERERIFKFDLSSRVSSNVGLDKGGDGRCHAIIGTHFENLSN